MPELIEVSIISEQLNNMISNIFDDKRELIFCNILSGKFLKKPIINWDIFQYFIETSKLKIDRVYNKGKLIIIQFEKPKPKSNMCEVIFEEEESKERDIILQKIDKEPYIYMLITLGMSGSITEQKEKHSRVEFKLNDKFEYNTFYYNDIRSFGNIYIMLTERELNIHLNKIGKPLPIDGFGNQIIHPINKVEFINNTKRNPNKFLVDALMDQKTICSGIGNYLQNEIMYVAKLNPYVMIKELTDVQINTVFDISLDIIKDSYKYGGVSIKDYKDINNKKGTYQDHIKIYRKKLDPLGNKIVSIVGPHNRTSWYCEAIQGSVPLRCQNKAFSR